MIHHYYHLYADGQWEKPLAEHLEALGTITAPMLKTVGVVGSERNAEKAAEALPADWQVKTGPSGWEQFTLDMIYEDRASLDGPVLYAHTKGAGQPTAWSDVWRRCMTRNLIRGWRSVSLHLDRGADTVGCHWLTPDEYPDTVRTPYYGGNFWWASPDHVKKLYAPSHETRYHAEAWLGSVEPEYPVDLAPGWPGAGCRDH